MGGCVLPVGRLLAAAVGAASLPRDGLTSRDCADSLVARVRGVSGVARAREVSRAVRTVEAGAGVSLAGLDGPVGLLGPVAAVEAAVTICAVGVSGCVVLAGEGREPDAAEVGARVRSGEGSFDPAGVETSEVVVLVNVVGGMNRVRWPPAVGA